MRPKRICNIVLLFKYEKPSGSDAGAIQFTHTNIFEDPEPAPENERHSPVVIVTDVHAFCHFRLYGFNTRETISAADLYAVLTANDGRSHLGDYVDRRFLPKSSIQRLD